jgi:tRNA-splicing ligase RtcB (3'-phosphate/5'-hydroxy nucleic acid ligase)
MTNHMHPNFPITLSATKAETLMWANPAEVEHDAQTQLRNAAAMPWVAGVRAMPDIHTGYGVPVGSVIAMRQAVSPSAVGVDIGCGMMAVKTTVKADDLPDDLGPMRASIERVVPVGFNSNDGIAPILKKDARLSNAFDTLFAGYEGLYAESMADRKGRVLSQCGTLGGGNHFIEVTSDDDGWVWLMLHSGSRNAGKEIADRHINTAKGLAHNNDLENVLPDRNLAVFLSGTKEMDQYMHDLYWAQDYAMLNRQIMMASLKRAFNDFFDAVTYTDAVNVHHNYVAEEVYEGEKLLVTRKGAIFAGAGSRACIPGSMGTGSYIVRGKGNPASYNSASHGAGRKMSRSKAKATFTTDDLAEQTMGVECRKDQAMVDEIPGAYKNLEDVMAAQVDLVEVEARLTTLLCVKG